MCFFLGVFRKSVDREMDLFLCSSLCLFLIGVVENVCFVCFRGLVFQGQEGGKYLELRRLFCVLLGSVAVEVQIQFYLDWFQEKSGCWESGFGFFGVLVGVFFWYLSKSFLDLVRWLGWLVLCWLCEGLRCIVVWGFFGMLRWYFQLVDEVLGWGREVVVSFCF